MNVGVRLSFSFSSLIHKAMTMLSYPTLHWFAFFLSLFCATTAFAADLTGQVVGVINGDTLRLSTGNQQLKVRLAEIDAPEEKQPWGNRAKQALSDLVLGKEVRVTVQTADRYKQILGRVFVGSMDVNLELVRQGQAWAYRQYTWDQRLLTAEQEARTARRGLWSQSQVNLVPPWEWKPPIIPGTAKK
ncbi:Uncharacterized endonuclease [Gammaproteobacteria bacterium]